MVDYSIAATLLCGSGYLLPSPSVHCFCCCRYLELDTAEFMMAAVMNSVISQGMLQSSKKGLQLFCDTPTEFKAMGVFGDQVRLQQVLADFLLNAIQFTPHSGWVEIKVIPESKKLPGGVEMVQLEFRWISSQSFMLRSQATLLLAASCSSFLSRPPQVE